MAALSKDFTASMIGALVMVGLVPASASVWVHKVTVWSAGGDVADDFDVERFALWQALRGTILVDYGIPEHLQAGEDIICPDPLPVDRMADLQRLMVNVYWSATPDAEIFDTRVQVDFEPRPRVRFLEA